MTVVAVVAAVAGAVLVADVGGLAADPTAPGSAEGRPAVASEAPADHAFLAAIDGHPVAWDPCTPIRWTMNTGGAPADVGNEVRAAIGRIAAASAFEFTYVGPTAAIPQRDWVVAGSDGAGTGYAPLIVAFVDAASTDLLDPGHPANGGADRIRSPTGAMYVSGSVAIDVAYLRDYDRGFGPGTLGGLLLHELGHALGLDHVASRSEVMNPVISAGPGELGPGDRIGLATLGSSRCCVGRATTASSAPPTALSSCTTTVSAHSPPDLLNGTAPG